MVPHDGGGALSTGKENSTTKPGAWAVFTRECSNKKKFPAVLGPALKRDKADLFNLWLENKKSLAKCALIVERIAERSTAHTAEMVAMKQRDMLKHWSAEKVTMMVEKRKKSGQFYKDPEWPDDEEENFYWCRPHGNKVKWQDKTTEVQKLSAIQKTWIMNSFSR